MIAKIVVWELDKTNYVGLKKLKILTAHGLVVCIPGLVFGVEISRPEHSKPECINFDQIFKDILFEN